MSMYALRRSECRATAGTHATCNTTYRSAHRPETHAEESRGRPAGISSGRTAGALTFSPHKAALAAQGRRVLQDVLSAASGSEAGDERIVSTPVQGDCKSCGVSPQPFTMCP